MLAKSPSDTYVAQAIGSSIFCTVEGRLVGLHIKTDHTFLLTVAQEPLIVHIGTFRFKSLASGRKEAAIVNASAFAKSFIEAFECTALDSAKDPTTTMSLPDNCELGTKPEVNSRVTQGTVQDDDAVGVELIITSPATNAQTAGSDATADIARRSSLVALHREKLDAEVRHQSPAVRRDSARRGSVGDTEYLLQAMESQEVTVRVKFLVFGVLHCVQLELKPCPLQPHIREPIIWGVLMDLYRTVVRQRVALDRYESIVTRSSGLTVGQQGSTTKNQSKKNKKPAAEHDCHSRNSTAVRSPRVLRFVDRAGCQTKVSPSTAVPLSIDVKSLTASFQGDKADEPATSDQQQDLHDRHRLTATALAEQAPPTYAKLSSRPLSGGVQQSTAATAGSLSTHPQGSKGDESSPLLWRYSTNAESPVKSVRSRPTSASTDFVLRTKYCEKVLKKAGVGDVLDEVMLPPAPPPASATQVRGTYANRQIQPMSTKTICLESEQVMYKQS